MQGGEGGWRVYPQAIFLAGRPVHVRKPVLVHDPIRFVALGSFPSVEHQSLLDTYWLWMADRLVGPGRLPVPGSGGPVRPRAIWVLSVPWREEVPLLFTVQSLACSQSDQYNNTSESEWGIEHTKGREWSREPNHTARSIQPWTERVAERFLSGTLEEFVRCNTRKLPRIEPVEVDLGYDRDGDRLRGAPGDEVVHHKLLVRRVEPEPRW